MTSVQNTTVEIPAAAHKALKEATSDATLISPPGSARRSKRLCGTEKENAEPSAAKKVKKAKVDDKAETETEVGVEEKDEEIVEAEKEEEKEKDFKVPVEEQPTEEEKPTEETTEEKLTEETKTDEVQVDENPAPPSTSAEE